MIHSLEYSVHTSLELHFQLHLAADVNTRRCNESALVGFQHGHTNVNIRMGCCLADILLVDRYPRLGVVWHNNLVSWCFKPTLVELEASFLAMNNPASRSTSGDFGI